MWEMVKMHMTEKKSKVLLGVTYLTCSAIKLYFSISRKALNTLKGRMKFGYNIGIYEIL